jgi:hypothetical protein
MRDFKAFVRAWTMASASEALAFRDWISSAAAGALVIVVPKP